VFVNGVRVMATAANPAIETFSFGGELAGVAGAAALRKTRSLVETAPHGRLFASISTLADTSAAAAASYEAAGLAELRSLSDEYLAKGNRIAKRLKTARGSEAATPLPAFMRQR
jgi:hypothetical protein